MTAPLLALVWLSLADDAHATTDAPFFQDYGAAMAAGAAALTAGDGPTALSAFEAAAALSDSNLDSFEGLLSAWLLLGDEQRALAAIDARMPTHPAEAATLWAWRGWVLRHVLWLPDGAAYRALAAYRHAESAGGVPDLACGVGHVRWGLGHLADARAAFRADPSPCAVAGLAALPGPLGVDLWLLGGGALYSKHVWRESGSLGLARVGVHWDDSLALHVTGRQVRARGQVPVGVPPVPGAAPALTETVLTQQEVWTQARVGYRAWSLGAGWARVVASGESEADGRLGSLRLGAPIGVGNVGLAGVRSVWADGTGRQWEADSSVRLRADWSLEFAVRQTQYTSADATLRTGTAVAVGVDWTGERVGAGIDAHAGREVRPVDVPAAVVWNLDEDVLGRVESALWVHVLPDTTLFVGASWLHLDATPPAPFPAPTSVESDLFTGNLGVRYHPRLRVGERR